VEVSEGGRFVVDVLRGKHPPLGETSVSKNMPHWQNSTIAILSPATRTAPMHFRGLVANGGEKYLTHQWSRPVKVL
jgi:hypothetical protein